MRLKSSAAMDDVRWLERMASWLRSSRRLAVTRSSVKAGSVSAK